MTLPPFDKEDRDVLVLAVRSGVPVDAAQTITRLSPEVVDAWLEQGAADRAAAKDTEAATFAEQFDNASRDSVRTLILAANVVRDEVRSNPEAARRHLREEAAERELQRARELTAEGLEP